ncbi:MAG: hypothetical protein Q8O59_01750 [bacterium]|nr:hypothetical protein [bacterium]
MENKKRMTKKEKKELKELYKPLIRPSLKKLYAEEKKLFDKIWYTRHLCGKKNPEWKKTPADIKKGASKAAEKVLKKYGKKWLLDYENDFEWGMINGKLEMIRWVLDGEHDNLDT